MIDAFYKGRYAIPVNDGNVVKWFYRASQPDKPSHLGLDFSWWEVYHGDIYAAQEGKVVDKFNSATCGNSLVLQHDFTDGTHSWTAYIHLHQPSSLKIGDQVKMNQVVGIKGNTGTSNGDHLHLYLTQPTKQAYTWETMKANAIDPYPYLYKSKGAKYVYLGEHLINKPYLEDLPQPVKIPEPVERNEDVKQVKVLIDYLFMRDKPAGAAYDKYAKPGIYNVMQEEIAGSYCWYKIGVVEGKEFWVASGGTRTEDLLPKKSPEEILTEKVKELEQELTKQETALVLASVENKELQERNDELVLERTTLQANIKALESEKEKYKETIERVKKALL